METPEEFMGSSNDQIHMPLKGRRTKRMKLLSGGGGSPDATSSSSSSFSGGGAGEEFAASSSISGEINIDHLDQISTEEEEDMANCLILLAQGDGRRPRQHQIRLEDQGVKIGERSISSSTNNTKRFNFDQMGKVGFYVYECKTCNRTFPSFQALGGHRASHKKPKPTTAAAVEQPEEQPQLINKIVLPPAAAVQIPTKPAATLQPQHKAGKIHECSICGLEFSSGQALGGHMRRHRPTAVSSAQVVVATNTDHHHHHNHNHNSSLSSAAVEAEMKQRNILELDLNLPAPEEDLRETKFQFTATPQTIVFSAPTLVDCHY